MQHLTLAVAVEVQKLAPAAGSIAAHPIMPQRAALQIRQQRQGIRALVKSDERAFAAKRRHGRTTVSSPVPSDHIRKDRGADEVLVSLNVEHAVVILGANKPVICAVVIVIYHSTWEVRDE